MKIPSNFEEKCKNKQILYYIHVPSTGGTYLKKHVFKNKKRSMIWKIFQSKI